MPMLSEETIQRAHDLLGGILLGRLPAEVLGLQQDEIDDMNKLCSVLCWVLGHAHNDNFADYLALVESQCNAAGWAMRDSRGTTDVPGGN